MLDVTILNLTEELSRADFDKLIGLVSPEKRERIERFRFFRDARNCLLGDVLARYEICRHSGIADLKQIEFSFNAYGKPQVENIAGIHFNITHTGNLIACAVSDTPVGIDAEMIEKTSPIDITDRCFTPDEAAYIAQSGEAWAFYEVWTKKESRLKWEGTGLNKPLSSFSVFDRDLKPQTYYRNVYQTGGVICHVCTAKTESPSVKTAGAVRNLLL